jgi:hypothetical protein
VNGGESAGAEGEDALGWHCVCIFEWDGDVGRVYIVVSIGWGATRCCVVRRLRKSDGAG